MQDSTACQRCYQPLVLDPTITNLSPSSVTLITSALPAPSTPSTLPPAAKLASLPPSSRESAEKWALANGITPPSRGNGTVGESYILLSDSILPPSHQKRESPSSSPLSANHKSYPLPTGLDLTDRAKDITANLHSILSSKTPISHPLCIECTAMLQAELQKELEELSRERDAYIHFQKEMVRNKESLGKTIPDDLEEEGLSEYGLEGTEEDWDGLMKKREELEKEEEKLKRILAEKERLLENAREEERRVQREEAEQEELETEFLLAHAAQSTESRHLEETLQSAKTRLLLSQSLLAHLESTNVYNDAFQIGHVPLEPPSSFSSGMSIGKNSLTVGTINGLRLGGRPIVDWDEINAAWGLVALCIDRIAVKVGYKFVGYKICPLGSFSRIEELPPGTGKYELYASSEVSRILQNRRFNHALVSLLDLLRQLVEYGKAKDRCWGVENIEIRKDRISGHSIKLPGISAMQIPTLSSMSIMGFGSSDKDRDTGSVRDGVKKDTDSSGEEQWTRACRAVLAVLKRILVVESEMDRSAVAGSVPVSR